MLITLNTLYIQTVFNKFNDISYFEITKFKFFNIFQYGLSLFFLLFKSFFFIVKLF